MKQWIKVIAIAALPACTVLLAFMPSTLSKKAKHAAKSFAVVELFTSEGCSSCPPADALVAKANKEFAGKIYILGFHVDYWNQLGWRDQYSSAAWTNRQKHYVELFNLNSAYTPQIVVNGKKEFVGSDEGSLNNTIQEELQNTSPADIALTAQKVNDKSISITYTLSKTDDAVLNIALVQLQATTAVKKGENQGRSISHINIVREFKSINKVKSSGSAELSIPSGADLNDYAVIAYLQDKDKWQVLGATETTIK